jgi:hypothetical protein
MPNKQGFWNLMTQIFQTSPKLFVMAAFLANFLSSSLIPLINVSLLHQVNRIFSYSVSVLMVSLLITLGNLIGSFFSAMLLKKIKVVLIIVISNSVLILFFISFFIIQLELLSYILLFTYSLISGVSNVKIGTAIMKTVPRNQLASFYTSYGSLMYLSMPVGMVIVPSIALLNKQLSALVLISLTFGLILMLIASRFLYKKAS